MTGFNNDTSIEKLYGSNIDTKRDGPGNITGNNL